MIYILISALFLVLLFEGTGIFGLHLLGIEKKGYAAVIGAAFVFAVLAILYLPGQLFGGTMMYVTIVTVPVLLLALAVTCYEFRSVLSSLTRKDSILILVAVAVFLLLGARSSITGMTLPEHYLNTPLSEIGTTRLQGLVHFSAFFSWVCDLPYQRIAGGLPYEVSAMYGLGLVYVCLSMMLIFNIVRSFKLKYWQLSLSLTLFLMCCENAMAWNITIARSGYSFSTLMMTLAIETGVRVIKGEREQTKYLWIPIFSAGLFCDHAFGLAGLAILFGFYAELFQRRKIRSLFDLTTFLCVFVIYSAALVARIHGWLSLSIFAMGVWFMFARYKKPLRLWIARSEEFMFDHGRQILWIGIPLFFAVASLILVLYRPNRLVSYTYYFSDFTELGYQRDYLFLHSNAVNAILNVFRWAGAAILLFHAKSEEERGIRSLLIGLMLFFLDPLCTPLLSYLSGPSVYRCFDVLFNPLTEAMMFVAFYKVFEWNALGRWILELALCAGAILGLFGFLA